MPGIKYFIPSIIKYPLWFIFKSPQRKIGWYTLWFDLFAFVKYLFYSFWPVKKPHPISICLGIYNRSDTFLNYFIPSLKKCIHLSLIELSIFDTGSTDVGNLESEIRKSYSGKLIFTSQQMPFSRACAFNLAVMQSNNENIFICDADFSLPEDIVTLCNRFTHKNTVWFPIVFYLYKNRPAFFAKTNGEWMKWGGKGLLSCLRSDFLKVGKLNENFTSWGYEDEELWERFYKNKYYVIRSRCQGLLHHWHPSLNPKYKKLEELADRGLL